MDPVASLSRFERAMLRVSTRRGLMPFVVTVSGVSVVMSVALTTVLMIAIGGDATEVAQALVIAVAVPAIVAPLATTLLGRLLRAVDAASAELHQLARLDALTGVRNRGETVASAFEPTGMPSSREKAKSIRLAEVTVARPQSSWVMRMPK